jgi:hypothetical protein
LYDGARNAYVTTRTVFDICCDLGGSCLWLAGLWDCRLRGRIHAKSLGLFRRNGLTICDRLSSNVPIRIYIHKHVKHSLCSVKHHVMKTNGRLVKYYNLTSYWPRHWTEVNSQFHVPATLPSVLTGRRLIGSQSQSARSAEEKNILPCRKCNTNFSVV